MPKCIAPPDAVGGVFLHPAVGPWPIPASPDPDRELAFFVRTSAPGFLHLERNQ